MLKARKTESLRRFQRDAKGLAAVEFALILPAMLIMLFGMFEVSSIVGCRTGISQLASSVADLTAQKDTLTSSDIQSIYAAAETLLYPYNTGKPTIRITSVVWDTVTQSATTGRVAWSCTQAGTGALSPAARAENSTKAFDNQLLTAGGSVVMVEVAYTYSSPRKIITFPIELKDSFFTKPRRVAQIPKPASCPSG